MKSKGGMPKTEEEWKKKLTPEQYRILRQKGTEPAFTGKYCANKGKGMYVCAGCGSRLFSSDAKFDSGSGWPSFYAVATKGAVKLHDDNSHGMRHIEVLCACCGSHLGHVFDDALQTRTGRRFCINSCALDFRRGKI